jgi:hypothetical protein
MGIEISMSRKKFSVGSSFWLYLARGRHFGHPPDLRRSFYITCHPIRSTYRSFMRTVFFERSVDQTRNLRTVSGSHQELFSLFALLLDLLSLAANES